MSTKKRSPAGRRGIDAETKTAAHDEVLQWAIAHLDDIAASHFSLTPAQVKQGVAYAKEAVCHQLRALEKRLTGLLEPDATIPSRLHNHPDEPITSKLRSAIKACLPGLPKALDAVRDLTPPPELCLASVSRYEVMHPVRAFVGNHLKDAGYVDIAASVSVPRELSVSWKGCSLLTRSHAYRVGADSLLFCDQDEIKRDIEAIARPAGACFVAERSESSLWLSIRVGDFTLGEVLQELKTLRDLEDQSHKVGLICDQVDPAVRKHLQHEGFLVIERHRRRAPDS